MCAPVIAKITKLVGVSSSVILIYPFIELVESSIVCIKDEMFVLNLSVSLIPKIEAELKLLLFRVISPLPVLMVLVSSSKL